MIIMLDKRAYNAFLVRPNCGDDYFTALWQHCRQFVFGLFAQWLASSGNAYAIEANREIVFVAPVMLIHNKDIASLNVLDINSAIHRPIILPGKR